MKKLRTLNAEQEESAHVLKDEVASSIGDARSWAVAQERGGGEVGALRGRAGLSTARCSLNLLRGFAKWLARILP